ncbi:unnamed protein product [Cyprideis torosa]|uniref:Uncharacterized protein n=1 Tax=Cyprideis torosa TaxID=163714 RepID=A0A7R8ZLI8_9CRUS|nr:unnamed protein product [Cyprideis torosa]CAG0886802.1 unnamed protein product [Cyprideis torosa]
MRPGASFPSGRGDGEVHDLNDLTIDVDESASKHPRTRSSVGRVDHLVRELMRLELSSEETLGELQKQIDDHDSELKNLGKEIDKTTKKFEEYKKILVEQDDLIVSLQEKLREKTDSHKKMEADNVALQSEVNGLEETLKKVRESYAKVKMDIKAQKSTIGDIGDGLVTVLKPGSKSET